MKLIPSRPGTIKSFSYDQVSRTLSAYHRSGSTTVCHDVPEAMFHVLEKTGRPEQFFEGYIAHQYDCETVDDPDAKPRH